MKIGALVRTDLGEKAKITKIEDRGLQHPRIHYEIVERADGSPGVGSTFTSDGNNLTYWTETRKSKKADDHIRPKHYGGADDPYEPLKCMLAWHGKAAVINFCILTAEKYLARGGKKDGEPRSRDWRKAAFYLNHAADLDEDKT